MPIQAQTIVNKQAKTSIKEMVSGSRKAVGLRKSEAVNGDELPYTIDVLPYKNALNTFDLFREFIVIDSNGDNTTWIWSEYNNSVLYCNGTVAADDWLKSPAIKLEAGKFYHFAIDAMCSASHYPEKFEVLIGTAPTASFMTQRVMDETKEENTSLVTYEKEKISVAETGYYYFGIHAISDVDMWNFTIANFLVEVGASPTVPAAVTDLLVTQIPDENKVSIRAISTVNDKGLESKPVTTSINVVVGIKPVVVEDKPFDVYALDGKLVRKQTNSLNGLKGIYVINGKTVMVK